MEKSTQLKNQDLRLRFHHQRNASLNITNKDAILDHAKKGGFLMVGGPTASSQAKAIDIIKNNLFQKTQDRSVLGGEKRRGMTQALSDTTVGPSKKSKKLSAIIF